MIGLVRFNNVYESTIKKHKSIWRAISNLFKVSNFKKIRRCVEEYTCADIVKRMKNDYRRMLPGSGTES